MATVFPQSVRPAGHDMSTIENVIARIAIVRWPKLLAPVSFPLSVVSKSIHLRRLLQLTQKVRGSRFGVYGAKVTFDIPKLNFQMTIRTQDRLREQFSPFGLFRMLQLLYSGL